MRRKKWLLLIGSIFLFIGLLMALISNYYNSRVMGKAALGVAMWAPDEGSPEWNRKVKLRKISNGCFCVGIFLTSLGIVLNTWGSLLD